MRGEYKWVFIALVSVLLPLAGCINEQGPLPVERDSVGFEFLVTPGGEEVELIAQRGSGLVSTALGPRALIPGTEIELAYFDYAFLPGDVLEIYASFRNVTDDAYFIDVSFTPVLTPEQGNYLSSYEPYVNSVDLGNGSLRPDEVTNCLWCSEAWFTFKVNHKGKPFSYFVNVNAVVGDIPDVIGAGEPLLQDGKLVYVGAQRPHPELEVFGCWLTLVRYLANGILDMSFGTDGITASPIGCNHDMAWKSNAGLQSDNHIVVGGGAAGNWGWVVRYSPDGQELIRMEGIGWGDFDYVSDLTILPDDNVVLAGEYGWTWYLTPELSDIGFLVQMTSLTLPDGRTLDGGRTRMWGDYDSVLVRHNPDGSLDIGFAGDGFLTIDVGGQDSRISTLTLQPDDSVLAAGWSSFCAGTFTVLVHPDATYDPPVCAP